MSHVDRSTDDPPSLSLVTFLTRAFIGNLILEYYQKYKINIVTKFTLSSQFSILIFGIEMFSEIQKFKLETLVVVIRK